MKFKKINTTAYIQILNIAVLSLSLVKINYVFLKSPNHQKIIQCETLVFVLVMTSCIKGPCFK